MLGVWLRSLGSLLNEEDKRDGQHEPHSPNPPAIPQLIEENGGELWQSEIIERTGWSASKTSRTLSQLEDDNRILRYEIGREKLVCLPGADPEEIESVDAQIPEQRST